MEVDDPLDIGDVDITDQGLGLFVAAGNLKERESVVLRFSPHLIMRKEKEVSMVDLEYS